MLYFACCCVVFHESYESIGGQEQNELKNLVLHVNVSIPHFDHEMSKSRICPLYVQSLIKLCPYLTFVQVMFPKSTFWPLQSNFWLQSILKIQNLSSFQPSFFVNYKKICRTIYRHILFMFIFLSIAWQHCYWTESGQSLDLKIGHLQVISGPWPTATAHPWPTQGISFGDLGIELSHNIRWLCIILLLDCMHSVAQIWVTQISLYPSSFLPS